MTASRSPDSRCQSSPVTLALASTDTSDVVCPTLGGTIALGITMGTSDVVLTTSDRHGRMRRRAHDI